MAKRIGLIAGGGQFPMLFSKSARKMGFHVFAAALEGETDPSLADEVQGIEWFYIGQLKRLISYFKEKGVTEAVMLGKIKKPRLFKTFRPDIKALAVLATLPSTHDDGILRAFAGVLEKEGILIRASTFLLPELLADVGLWTLRKLSGDERKDVVLGWRIAKEIGKLDIGQCVLVGKGSILAVEAVDGTDATIERGGKLGRENAIAVKVSKPNQDLRFDVPAIGVETVSTMIRSGVKALVVEAGRTVVFDREEMIRMANEHKIVIQSISDPADL